VRARSIVLLIPYLIILAIAVGCDELSATPPPPQMSSASEHIRVKLECSPIYECQFIVTVGSFIEDSVFDVELHADHGVYFNVDEYFPNIVSTNNLTSTVKDVHLQQHGTRVIRFPFTFHPQVALAGEYVVMIRLIGIDGMDIKLGTKALIYMDEYGNIRLMQEKAEFDAEYKNHYTAGSGVHDVHYTVLLDPGERPIHGAIFVKLIANRNGYNPVLTLHSDGGVEFDYIDPVFICANDGGSRIIVFPFQIIERENQPDGRYVFSISIEDDAADMHEILPIAVELLSESDTHQNQWLKTVYDIPTSPVSTPASTYSIDVETGYSQTISTGRNIDQQCNSPNDPSVTTVATVSNDEARPADDENIGGVHGIGDLDVGGGTPDNHSAEKQIVEKQVNDLDCDNWQSLVLQEQPLSLDEAYHQYKIADMGMDMNCFVKEFRLCNDIDAEVDMVTVYAGTPYYLPNGSNP